MAEIIPMKDSCHGGTRNFGRALAGSKTAGHVPQPFDSEKVPLILVSEVRRFLRVANQIEAESPRAAYLCRVHAFERAHSMDQNSNGRGVRQFKTALLKHLEQAEEGTKRMRRESSDALELKYLYDKYHNKRRISASESSEESIITYVILAVLLEVLKAVLSGTDSETFSDGEEIKGNSANYFRYNILPLDPDSSQQAIMRLPEIKASLAAIRNVRGLPSDKSCWKESAPIDLLDWLQHWFGFQEGNVANQREHLVLLLANLHIRQIPKPTSMSKLDDRAVNELMEKLFKNYSKWCAFLGRKSNIWLPDVKQEEEQHKILYISLYLLIWGEASNLRLMPECLCYIFHHMAYELSGVLAGSISLNTGEKVVPACGGEPESFLRNVVTPLYTVISEEARRNSNGTADHSKWRNYDDLNEYFWCIDCFKLGWPMRLECDFFCGPSTEDRESVNVQASSSCLHNATTRKWIGKTNYVEIRSFLHLFRSFDRMWSFFILAFQLMVIFAWHNLESPLELFNSPTLEDIMSVFVTSAFIRLSTVVLDIIFAWKTRQNMSTFQMLGVVLKFSVAAIWVITLPIYYAKSRQDSFCSADEDWSQFGRQCLPQYMVAVVIYMGTSAIEMAMFFFPSVGRFIETSDWRIFGILFWWAQPRLYVGRGMQEHQITLLKYSMFWLLLLPCKLLFSFQFEIKPLVESTKQIMEMSVGTYEWHEIFPKVKNNFGAVLAIWTPTTIVYFMDTQIWYSIFCSVFGGVYGMFCHLGEIRTMGMVRSKFSFLPAAFSARLIPPPVKKRLGRNARSPLGEKSLRETEAEGRDYVTFVAVWNQIIHSFREEDLISDRERDLMVVPLSSGLGSSGIHWPLFLLATKFSAALSMAREFVGEYRLLDSQIRSDVHMYSAVKECYDLLNNILDVLVVGDIERRIVSAITTEVETSVSSSALLSEFKMSELPALREKCFRLVEILFENNRAQSNNLVELLQDIFEIITKDMMIHGHRILDSIEDPQSSERDGASFLERPEAPLFTPRDGEPALRFPLPDDGPLKEQVRRLFLLLSAEETAMDIPVNLEARRRVSFFATSLFMGIPSAPKTRNMLSFSVLTPYYTEEVQFSDGDLHSSQDGASILSYMQKIYPDEWKNFLERMDHKASERPFVEDCDERLNEEITNWASFRGQTLSRTVRGMMYYREAIRFQAFLDMAKTEDIPGGFQEVGTACGGKTSTHSLSAQMDALADIKFTYVVSCQVYGKDKASGDPRARHILDLMIRYPSLRVAYIEEREVIGPNKPQKVYSSVLVKAVNGLEQEVYRIKLPGPPIIGEGKPENQNQGIIFTRGEALQTIGMNQDNYMEEAFKMRNVLQELLRPEGGRPPAILGLGEHIFTGSVSSLAWFMSYQESSFVTIGQRFLAKPLRVRFHYGHPDIFDRIFHVTRGGVSKASKTINLSEDVFAGFNTTLRCGSVAYREYMKVGKGRDVGLNQISKFEAKIANGNGEQALSRDVFRLGRHFDFFRMLSCYFTTVGFYLSSVMTVLAVYGFLYGQLYLGLSGLERALIDGARTQNMRFLETALASQSFIQLGLLTGLPMMMEVALEKGFRAALTDFILMHLQLASVFFTFSLGTKLHYFGRTILHGGAKYRPTGRKFVVFHASFTENYRLYSRSHFVKGFELLFLLILHNLYGSKPHGTSAAYALVMCSIWFLTLTWLFTPFLFNPSGFAWWKIVEDWMDWKRWMKNQGDLGLRQDKSWETWWNDEQLHLRHSGLGSRTLDILLSLRFFVYQYGLVYHLDISQDDKNIVVYVLSWAVIVAIFLLVKVVDEGRRRLSADFHLMYRLFKAVVLLGVVAAVMVLFSVCRLSVMDLFVCCFAFVPTGWGLLLIAQAIRPNIEGYSIWSSVEALAYTYDYVMGLVLFAPVAALAWTPVVSAIQTRVLFNQAFTRHLQIQPILGAKSKRR